MRVHSVAPVLLLVLTAACAGGSGDEADGSAGADQAAPSGPDPCTLVSQGEMEEFLGPLGEPPYRVDVNRRPDPAGDRCLYRDRSWRYVVLEVDWDDGSMALAVMGGATQTVADILGTEGTTDLDGAWDQAKVAFGRLMALKGNTAVTVDPMGSRLDRAAQARIAAIALGRAASPLSYDGAKASRSRKSDPTPQDPCSLVTRAEAEALMGRLRGDPTTSDDGSECVFELEAELFGSPIQQTLTVQWRDGFYTLGEERFAAGMAQTAMTKSMGQTPDLQQNAGGTGEPWDESQVLLGGRIIVVARDMLFGAVGTGVGGFDESRARELLRIAVRRALRN